MKKSILRECLRIAREKNKPELHPEYGNYHHYSFIIIDNQIIGYDTNKKGDASVYSKFGYDGRRQKQHAEFGAVTKYFKRIAVHDFECVNIRLNKLNELRLSAPCINCFTYLKTHGCTKVWFSTDTGFASISI